jgi:hypothetical protein
VESGLPKSNDSDRDYHKVTRQLHPDDKCPSGSSSDPSVIPEGKTGTVHLDDKGVHPPRLTPTAACLPGSVVFFGGSGHLVAQVDVCRAGALADHKAVRLHLVNPREPVRIRRPARV